jgi:hypothetical protein
MVGVHKARGRGSLNTTPFHMNGDGGRYGLGTRSIAPCCALKAQTFLFRTKSREAQRREKHSSGRFRTWWLALTYLPPLGPGPCCFVRLLRRAELDKTAPNWQLEISADLIDSACGRLINTAKAGRQRPVSAYAGPGFFLSHRRVKTTCGRFTNAAKASPEPHYPRFGFAGNLPDGVQRGSQ